MIVRVLLVITGIVLLLPGACSLFFTLGLVQADGFVLGLWLVGMMLGGLGVWLIYKGFKK